MTYTPPLVPIKPQRISRSEVLENQLPRFVKTKPEDTQGPTFLEGIWDNSRVWDNRYVWKN